MAVMVCFISGQPPPNHVQVLMCSTVKPTSLSAVPHHKKTTTLAVIIINLSRRRPRPRTMDRQKDPPTNLPIHPQSNKRPFCDCLFITSPFQQLIIIFSRIYFPIFPSPRNPPQHHVKGSLDAERRRHDRPDQVRCLHTI